jgi:hypothetical protein
MRLDVFCAWGDGPDVGINLERTKEEAQCWINPDVSWFLDFTAAEARELARKLVVCAEAAERLDREYEEYARRDMEAQTRTVEPGQG